MAGKGCFPAAGPHNSPAEEANPFSFKEFVRSKNQSSTATAVPGIPGGGSGGGGGGSASPKGSSRFSLLLLDANTSSPDSPALNVGFQESFFPDPTATQSLLEEEDDEEEEEDWSSSYQPSSVEEAHLARTPQASLGRTCDSYYPPSDSLELPAFSPWQLRGEEEEGEGLWLSSLPPEEGDRSSLADRGAARDPRFYPLPQPTYEELKEENAKLRSKIGQVQAVFQTQAERVKELEKMVEENKWKEEKEARDLEAMALQVEENLRLMTKRAMKAESSFLRVKQENALLQVQVRNYRLENEALKSGHLANLAVVKQNADTALQNLLAVITKSRVSVKQLISGAEELQLVVELLKSIDKISELPQDSP